MEEILNGDERLDYLLAENLRIIQSPYCVLLFARCSTAC